MDVLPYDIANDMKSCALKAGLSASHEHIKMSRGEAKAYEMAYNIHAVLFRKKSSDFLSAETCEEIVAMFWHAAQYTAIDLTGLDLLYNRELHKESAEQKFQSIVERGEMTKTLISNVKEMGWNAARYYANTASAWGKRDDAEEDKAKYESHFSKIHEVNLVAIYFCLDGAKILGEKPVIVADQKLINNGDVQQSMEFTFTVDEGKTYSMSKQTSFKFGVKVGFDAGFIGFAGRYGLSLEVSQARACTKATTTSKTKSYKFPVDVPPHSTYVAKGMVHEARMKVPYELVFDFGGTKKSMYGTWEGVAVSSVTYKVSPVH